MVSARSNSSTTRRQQKHQQQRHRAARATASDSANDAADADSDGDAHAAPAPLPPPPLLAVINRATKYGVSLTVLMVVLWTGPSARACWDVAGSVASSGVCKALKRALNHARPQGAPASDPGMPSSHANSLAFLAATAALELARLHELCHALDAAGIGGGASEGALAAPASAACLACCGKGAQLAVLAAGAFLSWLRVRLGFHSPDQVWAGAALGGGGALAWHAASGPALGVLAAAAGSEAAAGAGLRAVAGVAVAAFVAGNARSWLPAAFFGGGGGGEEGRA